MSLVDPGISKNRSSSIFPLFSGKGVRNKLVFQDYWSFKNSQSVQAFVMTLRDGSGQEVGAKTLKMGDLKAYSFDVYDLFDVETRETNQFDHSVEVEIFFLEKPLFNYPAIFIVYSHADGVGLVHSCLRSLDQDEELSPAIEELPQTGFDIFATQNCDTHILFNTAKTGNQEITFDFSDFSTGQHFSLSTNATSRASNQLHAINLSSLVRDKLGPCDSVFKASFNFKLYGIFPRYYIANVHHRANGLAPGLTHSFFDQSNERPDTCENSYLPSLPTSKVHQSGLTVPVFMNRAREIQTNLICYESNSSSRVSAELSVCSENGEQIHTTPLASEDVASLKRLDLSEIVRPFFDKDGSDEAIYSVNIRLKESQTRIPRRMKFALNVFHAGRESSGTNICFTALVIDDVKKVKKPFSTRWGPIGGDEDFMYVFQANDFWYDVYRETEEQPIDHSLERLAEFNLFNSHGENKRFERPFNLGQTLVFSKADKEIADFLNGQTGTLMCKAPAPFLDGWVLSFKKEAIGGDHAF